MKMFLQLMFRVYLLPLLGQFFANPVGYAGRGTIIGFTPTPVTGASVYQTMPQLEKFERSGTKVDFDDATCLDSPGNNKFPIPIVVDNGKYSAEGVFDPQNAGIVALLGPLQAMLQLGYKITLIDGSTFTGLCYVSQFEVPKVDRYKVNRFSFEVTIFGVETLTPQGATAIAE
jgi:hypothetical protein